MTQKMFPAILKLVRRIPRGKVATYGDVAYAAGFPGAARQVVWALHSANGLPWHRVVGSGGKILLPGEAGFEQRMRLQAEGVRFAGLKIPLDEYRYLFFGRKSAKKTSRKSATKKQSSHKKVHAKTRSTRNP